MAGPDPELIFSAYHAEGFYPTDLGFLDLEIPWKNGPYTREKYFLPCCYIWSAADYSDGLGRAVIDFGNMEMIGIRMGNTLKNFRNDYTCETSGNLFLLLHAIYFDAD